MLFRFGTWPAAMIRSASGRIASASSTARVPRVLTRGAANRSVAASMASRASVPAWVGRSSSSSQPRSRRCIAAVRHSSSDHPRLARRLSRSERPVAACMTSDSQGSISLATRHAIWPSPRCSRIAPRACQSWRWGAPGSAQSGVRCSQRSAREVSRVHCGGGECRGSANVVAIDRLSQQPTKRCVHRRQSGVEELSWLGVGPQRRGSRARPDVDESHRRSTSPLPLTRRREVQHGSRSSSSSHPSGRDRRLLHGSPERRRPQRGSARRTATQGALLAPLVCPRRPPSRLALKRLFRSVRFPR